MENQAQKLVDATASAFAARARSGPPNGGMMGGPGGMMGPPGGGMMGNPMMAGMRPPMGMHPMGRGELAVSSC